MQKKSSVCAIDRSGAREGRGKIQQRKLRLSFYFNLRILFKRQEGEDLNYLFSAASEKVKVLECLKGEITNFESEKSRAEIVIYGG